LKFTIEELIKPVPVTAILVLPDPAKTDTGDIDTSLGEGLTRVRVADPDLVESWVEVAVMEADPEAGTAAGAVYSPELEIVPETADQVTAEL
jgi:hypothetical protein